MTIGFPKRARQKCYKPHYNFLLDLLKSLNLNVVLYGPESSPGGSFVCRIDDQRAIIDYADFLEAREGISDSDICFKYHYSRFHYEGINNIYPLGPMSFHRWDDYFTLEKEIVYSCNSDRILSNQRPHHGARKRRAIAQEVLRGKYGDDLDVEITDQPTYWEKINDCLVSVCVPGQRGTILDRGQFQYMAFGACTISPRLNIVLPNMVEPEPGVHYIECANKFSDLIEKVEWCKSHRDECIQIGQNAKRLFKENCTPVAVWEWMNKALDKVRQEAK